MNNLSEEEIIEYLQSRVNELKKDNMIKAVFSVEYVERFIKSL